MIKNNRISTVTWGKLNQIELIKDSSAGNVGVGLVQLS